MHVAYLAAKWCSCGAAKWCSYGAAVIGPKLMLRRHLHARQLSMCAAFCVLSMIVDFRARVWQCMLDYGNVC